MTATRHISRVCAALLLCAQSGTAQVAVSSLRPVTAVLGAEFTRIRSVRELADGRVLVTDPVENLLAVADFNADEIQSLGRVGTGPGEFERVGRLLALSGDSTILLDDGSGYRWLVLHGQRIVATMTPNDSLVRLVGTDVFGADALGRILTTSEVGRERLDGGAVRSIFAARVINRRTLTADSVGAIRGISTVMRTTGEGESLRRFVFQVVFSEAEQILLAPDGWVAIARQEPYQVEWIPPRGGPSRTSTLPWSYPRVSETEKRAWENRVTDGRRSTNSVPIATRPFAAVIPPYRDAALLIAPRGQLVIALSQWSESRGNEYHVVSRDGGLIAHLRLPNNVRIVGFGARAVYTAAADADGIERLQLHPWP